uniref:Uncharacterized protein n=1 Tax=Ananas comosus var. bracteatus TaxID=296719 RepID=A0A6V7QA16_ANACO|nr:unnamed protein product [Ananas comosus var. bracteatus]
MAKSLIFRRRSSACAQAFSAVVEEETGAAEEEEEEKVRKKKVLLRIYDDGTDLFFDLADEVCTFKCISHHRARASSPDSRTGALRSSSTLGRRRRRRRRGAIFLPVASDLGIVGEEAHEPTRRVLVRVHEPAHDPYQYPTHHGQPSDALLDPCGNPNPNPIRNRNPNPNVDAKGGGT